MFNLGYLHEFGVGVQQVGVMDWAVAGPQWRGGKNWGGGVEWAVVALGRKGRRGPH